MKDNLKALEFLEEIRHAYVLLWSFSQGCFHIETCENTIVSGLNAYANCDDFQDYIVLAIHPEREAIERVRVTMIGRFGQHGPKVKPRQIA